MEIKDGMATLDFDHVSNGGLYAFDVEVRGFAMAGEDRQFKWAQAKIQVNSEVLTRKCKSVAVRYGWADNPVSTS